MKTIKQELHDHLSFLTNIKPARNWMNRSSLTLAADYISDTFKSKNYAVEEQKWEVGKFEYSNIIAKYKPHLKERLIVGAHYDVFSDQPGADDNGSGVAGLLVLSNLVAQHQPNLPYGIDFVSYCLEEPPYFGTKNMGSYIHANSLADQKTPVIGMICLDMIGYFDERPDSQQYPKADLSNNMPRIGNFIGLVGLQKYTNFNSAILEAMQREDNVQTLPINFPTSDGLAGLSDHRNYWHFSYPAVMINDTAKYRNPNYHEASDKVETLDFDKMAAVVKAVYLALSKPLPATNEEKESNHHENDTALKSKFFNRFCNWIKGLFTTTKNKSRLNRIKITHQKTNSREGKLKNLLPLKNVINFVSLFALPSVSF